MEEEVGSESAVDYDSVFSLLEETFSNEFGLSDEASLNLNFEDEGEKDEVDQEDLSDN